MNNMTLNIAGPLFQMAFVLALAPMVKSFIKKAKAMFQGRQGPPLMQGYYDLFKYFRKETIVSNQTSWLFLTTPVVLFATSLISSLLVPTFSTDTTFGGLGGLILLIYLLGLGRFFLASAAMEPGGSFCCMASSREMMLASLIEPVMLISFIVIALMTQSTDLTTMISQLGSNSVGVYSPAYSLCLISLLIAGIAEVGRIPFDNPETHYELTMIHEGMLLDYSGKPLGLLFWGDWIKQTVILSILANLFFPWGMAPFQSPAAVAIALGIYLLKLIFVSLLVALVETVVTKVRLFRVTEILGVSFVFGMLGLILYVQQQLGASAP